MNRILLLVIGVATGMWMLRDLAPSATSTVCCSAEVNTGSAPEPGCGGEPLGEPAVMVRPDLSISPIQPRTAKQTGSITVARYTVLVQDESSASDGESPEPATPQAQTAENERAALGRWATGVLDSLMRKPAVVAKPAATTAVQEKQPSDGAATQPTEHVAQRNRTVAAPATPIAPNALPTEKPADMDKPAVTAADPEDAPATDEKPALSGKPAETASDKAADSSKAATTAETPATTEPKTHDPAAPAPKAAAVAPPLDAAPAAAVPSATVPSAATASPKETSPVIAAPAVLPPAALPQAVAPVLAPVVPVRQPLTPELQALAQKVHYALWMYQHQRLLNTATNVPWEVMHRLVAYGAATEVLRDGPGGEPVNAIGWLLWGGRCNSQPLLILSGGRPMAMVGVGVQGHAGQFLGMLAQSHVRPESPFELQGQHFTVRDLIEQEKLGCEANTELTFELIAMSYYVKSDAVWTARTGEQWSISRLIQEEIKQPINGAACGGSHRLFGLKSAYKMRVAEGKPVDGEFLLAQKYVRAYQAYTLGRIENRDGSFSTDWFKGPADNGNLDRKIQTTGHILEWLVFSLEENQLRDPRVVQSVDFLATQIVTHPNRAWSVGPLGHALHAMEIYESRVLVQPELQSKPQQTASAKASVPAAPVRTASKPSLSSVPPQPKADPARPAVRPMPRPSTGTPNAAAATAELQGPDLGVTR